MKWVELNNSLKFFFASVLLFSAVYLPKLSGAIFPVVVYLLGLTVAYAYIKDSRALAAIISNKYSAVLVFWVLILIVYSFFVSTFIGNALDFSIPYNYIVWILIFIAPALVAATLLSNSGSEDSGYKSVAVIATAQAIFIVAAVLLPSVRELFGNVLDGDSAGHLAGWEFRVQGLSGSGGASLSLLQGFSASLCVFLFVRTKKQIWLLASFVIALSALPVGRTGVLWFCFFFILFLPGYLMNKVLLMRSIASLILATCFLTLSVLFLSKIPAVQIVVEFVLKWGLEPFRYALNPSKEPTVKLIADMWVLPSNFSGYLFGSGLHIVDGVNLVGDPGYLRYFYYFGSFGVVLHYSFFVWLMLTTRKHFQDRNAKKMVVLLYALFFVFELKEPFFGKNNVLLFFLFFYSLACTHRRRLQHPQSIERITNPENVESQNAIGVQ